jgi:RND family efflux transporter MFP subunit
MRRALAPVVAAAVGLGAGCGQPASREKPATPVRIEVVATHAATHAARYSATIRPARQVDLAFRVGGYARELMRVTESAGSTREVQEGDHVAPGAVLARLRDLDYDVRLKQTQAQVAEAEAVEAQATAQLGEARAARGQAEAQVAEAEAVEAQAAAQLGEARAARGQAEALVAEAQAAFQAARLDYERASRLFATQSLTRPEHEASQARFESARARLDAARAQVDAATARLAALGAQIDAVRAKIRVARAQIGLAEARIAAADAQRGAAAARKERARHAAREAELVVADTALTVPFEAVVLRKNLEIGTLVQAGAPAFVVGEMSTVKAVFGVPDLVVEHLRPGSPLSLTVEAVPGSEFRGLITRIAPSADPASRLFDVEVTVANRGRALRAGMIATVTVVEQAAARPLPAVPLAAIVRPPADPQGYAVFVVETESGRDVARLRRIEPGVPLGNRIAVPSGLRIGDRVVASGTAQLLDGQAVRVVP